MTKILKSGKSALSLIVAFAVIAVSLFVAIPAINIDTKASGATLTWDGTLDSTLADNGETGADEANAIIIDTPAEFAYLAKGAAGTYSLASTTKPVNLTAGKYYKVADGIAAFNMQALSGITIDSTLADVKAATAEENWDKTWNGMFQNATYSNNGGDTNDTVGFQGTFDGNGITVFGLYGSSHAMGLFPTIDGGATIKNVAVKNSRFISTSFGFGAGAIFGQHLNFISTAVNIENCAVINCDIQNNVTDNGKVALIGGAKAHRQVNIKNCLTQNNSLTKAGSPAYYGGYLAASAQNGTIAVSNCVSIGDKPYGEGTMSNAPTYSNVYTDQTVAFSGITTTAVTSGNTVKTTMPNLKWDTVWFANGDTPTLRVFHNISATDNNDGTHAEKCSDCGIQGAASAHVYTLKDGKGVCDCGNITNGITLTWDGTLDSTLADNGETGADEANAIIIDTPAELAYLAKGAAGTYSLASSTKPVNLTAGKYYKVADGIAAFNMNVLKGITINSTLAQVKSATAEENYDKTWNGMFQSTTYSNNGGDTNDSVGFQGTFDGNGITVFGLYGANHAMGLFPTIDGDATIKNVAVKNSRFISNNQGMGAGAIFGKHLNWIDKKVTIENCAVINCDIQNIINGNVALIAGVKSHRALEIKNCYTENNSLTNTGTGYYGGYLASSAAANTTISNCVSVGDAPYGVGTMSNAPTYSKVYTDQNVTFEDVIVDTAMANKELELDPTIWFFNKTKAPVLRLFHDINAAQSSTDPAAGHVEKCADSGCALEGIAVTAHDWSNKDGVCKVCEYTCAHTGTKIYGEIVVDNCAEGKKVEQTCNDCGKQLDDKVEREPGHAFGEQIPAQERNCGQEGWPAYYQCSRCDGCSTTNEPTATTVEKSTLILPIEGAHTPQKVEGSEDIVYTMSETTHKKYCTVCKKYYDEESHTDSQAVPAADPKMGHIGQCTTCLYGQNSILPHNFTTTANKCDDCGWECTEHEWEFVADSPNNVAYDCVTSEKKEFACKWCDETKIDTTRPADGHTFVYNAEVAAKCNGETGRAAYNHCSECGFDYAATADALTVSVSDKINVDDLVITTIPACSTFNLVKAVEPKCDEPGAKAYHVCTTCGKYYEDNEGNPNVDALIAPDALDATIKIDPTGHSYDVYLEDGVTPEWKFDNTAHWHVCTICDIVEKADHKLVTDDETFEGVYTACETGCGYETFEHSKTSDDKMVTITAGDGVFSKDVWTKFVDICDEDDIYSDIKVAFSDNGVRPENMLIYDILPDEKMAEGGEATITFKVPENFGEKLAIYYVDVENQKIEALKTEVITNEKTGERTAKATVDHFSIYVLVDLGADDTTTGGDEDTGDTNVNGGDAAVNGGNGIANGDSSNTSPATGESAIAIAVIAALMGAAFVIVRKAIKA